MIYERLAMIADAVAAKHREIPPQARYTADYRAGASDAALHIAALIRRDAIEHGPLVREALAAYAHEAWSGWMKYMFGKCERSLQQQVVIPDWAVERWTRQMNTLYAELPEAERASDRKEADEMLALL